MKIYDENGYLDIPAIVNQGMTFNFITGARGTGKTYGTLKYVIENNIPFVYMRRTSAEMEVLWGDEKQNPFNKLNSDMGWNLGVFQTSKYTGGVFERQIDKNGNYVKKGRSLGIVLALSTVANIRGFDGSEFKFLFYDEFIPEAHVRKIKRECDAFLNCYETINRNRELGKNPEPPVKVICASNSNRLDNEIYMGLGFITKVDEMKQKRQMTSIMPKRKTMLVNMEDSPISEQKRHTALYQLVAGSEFERMALDNEYIGEDARAPIGSKNLKEYKPVVRISNSNNDITVYVHKSKTEFYVSSHSSGNPPLIKVSKKGTQQLHNNFGYLYYNYLQDNIVFETRLCEMLFTRAFS